MNGTSASVSDALLLSVEKILQCRNLTDVFHDFVELLTSTVTLASACTCSIVLKQRMAFVLLWFCLGSVSRSFVYAEKAGRCCQKAIYSMDFRDNLADWMFTTQLYSTSCGVHSIQNGCRLMINSHSLGPFLLIFKIAFLSCAGGPDTKYSFWELGDVLEEQATKKFWGWKLLLSVDKAGFPLNTKGSKIVWLKGSINTCHRLSKLYLITRVVWEKQKPGLS